MTHTYAALHRQALDLCDRLRSVRDYTSDQRRRQRAAHALYRAHMRADRRGRRYMLTCGACGRPTPLKANGIGMCCWGKDD